MTTEVIDVADLDCIFLTYDEPRKEEFWIRIQNMIPWAKRVDGIKGSDAAHKAAAQTSDTDRFILIDGDNIPDEEFFNKQLTLDDANRHQVFRWRAKNFINGLTYGNGGISCWTKKFASEMQTHEASTGNDETDIEFCYHPDYIAMNDCYSTTYPNATPFQAWRAGFREGVKAALDRGRRLPLPEFTYKLHQRNYDHLCIWHTVGQDVENGWWAIYGARLGTALTMLENWDYKQVQSFDKLADLWTKYENSTIDDLTVVGQTLRTRLGLPITDMSEEQSKFFKYYYVKNQRNLGIMVTEKSLYNV